MPSSLNVLESYDVDPYTWEFYECEPRHGRNVFLSHDRAALHDSIHSLVPYSDTISLYFQEIAERFWRSSSRLESAEEDLRHYTLPVSEAFQLASKQYSSISVDPEVMAGAPCIEHTRIPVYMILDAIEHYGNIEGALRSYPTMDLQRIRDAIGFAKLVVECPLDDKSQSFTG